MAGVGGLVACFWDGWMAGFGVGFTGFKVPLGRILWKSRVFLLQRFQSYSPTLAS